MEIRYAKVYHCEIENDEFFVEKKVAQFYNFDHLKH